jgi:cytochrome c oxidase assembly protein subunit 15
MKSMTALLRAMRTGRGLAAYAGCVLGFMVMVVLWGAVVRATGSGAGCGNHWPLCNGDFFPHHPRLATVIEFTHRSMTGVCTTLVAALIAWVLLARDRGHRVRTAVVWVGVLLITEALLGAVLVKGGYVESNASNMRVFMQCIHFSNTMLLLGSLALTAWWLRGAAEPVPQPSGSRNLAWLSLLATLIVGATGSVAALADTLFPSTSLRVAFAQDFSAAAPLIVRLRWLHPAAALVGVACAAWLCLRLRSRMAGWVGALIVLQLLLGGADVLLLAPTWMQVLHLLGADLYWIALVMLCADVIAPTTQRTGAEAPILAHTISAI